MEMIKLKDHYYIGKAKPDQYDIIIRYIRELADIEGDLDKVKLTRSELAQYIDQQLINCYIIEEREPDQTSSCPIGYAITYHSFSNFEGKVTYLEDILIRKSGIGIGTQVFKYLMSQAILDGSKRFEFGAYRSNTPAIDYYEHIGAPVVDDWINYRFNHLQMERFVESNNQSIKDGSELGEK
ncbi:diamine acetyltransferase 2 [Lactococcus lactis subsp. lactis]|uniref:Diamine acetyltransferase 2 n=1 Tax=Lactococcus lactis subsp. lactis TaxID=1360 RepID=A0A0V8E107_LACLL|nr:diamine acetyltransferase 2 [Lactococcus lactis subsp. lactis]